MATVSNGRTMSDSRPIDITFDFRSDTPLGKDPDAWSPTLRRYHRLLWSKPLPSGLVFDLSDATRAYLHHRSELGEFWLTSDAVIPTFKTQAHVATYIKQQPEEAAAFDSIGYTIGGMMVFPGNRIGRKNTINGARGFHPRIKDRFDLTVECIRRHYGSEASPLSDVLARYADYFRLFGDFRGYAEFFLLQDLVNTDCTAVRFFMPFDNFKSWPVPGSLTAYLEYRDLAGGFVEARNRRIASWEKISLRIPRQVGPVNGRPAGIARGFSA